MAWHYYCSHGLPPLAASLLVLVLSSFAPAPARSDFAADRAECQNKLLGLATCMTFVTGSGGTLRAPTPDCCDGFKEVATKSFKCLCELIKDRNEPGIGFKVNVTRALLLPSKCDVPLNVTDCPRALKLASNSTEAKEFEQFGEELQHNAVTGKVGANSSRSEDAKNKQPDMSAGTGKRWLQLGTGDAACAILLLVLHIASSVLEI